MLDKHTRTLYDEMDSRLFYFHMTIQYTVTIMGFSRKLQLSPTLNPNTT